MTKKRVLNELYQIFLIFKCQTPETLFKRGYIRRERKSLFPTDTGRELISTIHEDLLKSAELTGIWERKLRQIERGDYSAQAFIDELKTMVGDVVFHVMNS